MESHPDDTQQITVNVSALAYGGSCIGEVASDHKQLGGKKAFIREVVPGEKVQAIITHQNKKTIEAKAISIIHASSERVSPQCPYFGECGGCDLQHISLEYQRHLKTLMVETTLKHHAQVVPTQGCSLLGEDLPGFHYRKRIALHVDREGRIGFYKAKSGEVVNISQCCIASHALNQALATVSSHITPLAPAIGGVILEEHACQVCMIVKLREQHGQSQLDRVKSELATLESKIARIKITLKDQIVFEQTAETALHSDAPAPPYGHFSQVNEAGNALLTKTVVDNVKTDNATDLYAGYGNFALPLAAAGKSVDAVEIDSELVQYGETLANSTNLEARLNFFGMSCEKFVRAHKLGAALILDPPRSGARNIMKCCDPRSQEMIIYVSCGLPTLTRDLKTLSDKGFILQRLYLIDMFPQTHHVETIAILSGKSGG